MKIDTLILGPEDLREEWQMKDGAGRVDSYDYNKISIWNLTATHFKDEVQGAIESARVVEFRNGGHTRWIKH